MAWTTPTTWTSGQTVTAATLNTQLRDNLTFAATAKAVSLGRTSTLSVPNASWTAVPWQVADFETVETWTSGSNPDRLKPQVAGYYLVTFKTWWTAAASGYYAAKVMLNGATNLHTDKRAAGGLTTPCWVHGLVHLNGTTDYLTCHAYQTSGSALDLTITPGEETSVSLAWVGF